MRTYIRISAARGRRPPPTGQSRAAPVILTTGPKLCGWPAVRGRAVLPVLAQLGLHRQARASALPVRPPASRHTARWPGGLWRDVSTEDVISPISTPRALTAGAGYRHLDAYGEAHSTRPSRALTVGPAESRLGLGQKAAVSTHHARLPIGAVAKQGTAKAPRHRSQAYLAVGTQQPARRRRHGPQEMVTSAKL